MAFTALATDLMAAAKTLDAYIAKHNLPTPTIAATGPPLLNATLDINASLALGSILAASHKITHLAQGPASAWFGTLSSCYGDALTYSLIYQFNIAEHVPLSGGASFEEVAKASGLALRDFEMVVRYAMTNFVFAEPKPGWIEHTASSAALKEMKLVRALAGMATDELWPALGREAEVMARRGKGETDGEEVVDSSWALANNATQQLFAELANNHPTRATNMAFAMESLASMIPPTITTDNYAWSALPSSALIIDVGGGKGFVDRALAAKFPDFRFIVQDLKDTADAGRAQCPAEFKDRIEFVTHDFFAPQPSENKKADLYFMRAIVHDWPDKYVIKILQALIPGLKRGTKIVIQDPHTPDVGEVGWWQERQTRGNNLRMKVFFNARDRERGDWEGLFARADERFKIKGLHVHNREVGNETGGLFVVVEAIWEGD